MQELDQEQEQGQELRHREKIFISLPVHDLKASTAF